MFAAGPNAEHFFLVGAAVQQTCNHAVFVSDNVQHPIVEVGERALDESDIFSKPFVAALFLAERATKRNFGVEQLWEDACVKSIPHVFVEAFD